MDLTSVIKELIEERDMIEHAILSLERIAMHRGKRRGRPPAWMSMLEAETNSAKKRGRPRGSKNSTKPS